MNPLPVPILIRTRRTLLGFSFDCALTALAWAGFMYLFTWGVVQEVSASYLTGSLPSSNELAFTIDTLGLYLLIGAVNGVLVALWGHYRKQISRRLAPYSSPLMIAMDNRATQFQLSDYQLDEVENSRVTIVHHLDDGEIDRLETDQLSELEAATAPEGSWSGRERSHRAY